MANLEGRRISFVAKQGVNIWPEFRKSDIVQMYQYENSERACVKQQFIFLSDLWKVTSICENESI